MKFHVPDMSCGHCKAAIERSVKDADGSARLEFDMENRVVSIETDLPAQRIAEALKAAGYDSSEAQQTA